MHFSKSCYWNNHTSEGEYMWLTAQNIIKNLSRSIFHLRAELLQPWVFANTFQASAPRSPQSCHPSASSAIKGTPSIRIHPRVSSRRWSLTVKISPSKWLAVLDSNTQDKCRKKSHYSCAASRESAAPWANNLTTSDWAQAGSTLNSKSEQLSSSLNLNFL